jgi:four helix bundle protein
MLDHERLDVYRRSLEFLATAFALSEGVPRGYAALADQLRRAAMPIPLNIAEAVGKSGGPDRRRFYTIARGSAMECGAILDVIAVIDRSEVAGAELGKGKELIVRIVEMLTRMSQ